MRQTLTFFLIALLPYCSISQASLDDINNTRCQHSLNGMIALSGWTGANLIAGTVGVATTNGELQHFFEMNLYFNAVNLAIAVPGLISTVKEKRSGLNFENTLKKSQQIKTLYLVNVFLDLTYITGGFLMREIGHNNSHDIALRDRLVGYGDSFILQGGFLALFDFVEFLVLSANHKRIDDHWKKISFQPQGAFGIGMGLQYNLSYYKRSQPVSFSSFE